MLTKISIIVPVYNSSKYLKSSINSLITQSLPDIEIICVDDHSDDNSLSILENMAKTDNKIKIIAHESNQGLLKTRADGVKLAKGQFIMFMDADDEYVPEACSELYKHMIESDCDFIQYGTEIIPSENADKTVVDDYIHYLKPYAELIENESIIKHQFDGSFNWHVWTKIYKAEICKKAYLSAGEQYLILTDDLYISFFITYYSRKTLGVCKNYYRYHLGRGYTGGNNGIKQLQTLCANSWYVENCINFLIKEGKYDDFGYICDKEPLLQLGHCVSIWKEIKNFKESYRGRQILKKYWSRPPYIAMLKQMMGKDRFIVYHFIQILKQENYR